MLGIEVREQGTLQCHRRIDKLCVGREAVGDTRGQVTPVPNQTLYTLVLILRLFYLPLAEFLRIRRDRTIRGI